ncbi:MAG: FG-GAP repeat domain-containing protein, partial [bacterium]
GDIDGDGDADLVLGGLFWYENPGQVQGFEGPWKTHLVSEHKTHDVELADLEADGDLDIVTRDQSAFGAPNGDEVHIWMQDGPDSWSHTMLTCIHGEGIRVADLDGDLDWDIVVNGFWFENRGDVLDARSWLEHKITDFHHSSSVAVGDLNGDGRNDVVLVPSELRGETSKMAWYEARDAGQDRWVEHVIEPEVETVYHSLQVSDIDGDGLLDLITAEMHQGVDPDEVLIYLNQRGGKSWKRQVISSKGSHGVQVEDVDGDGRPDIMGANWSGPYQPIELWMNRGK